MSNKQATIFEALHSLRPGSNWIVKGDTYDTIVWFDDQQTQPTKDEVDAELQRLNLYIDYKEKRVEQYPSIGDQLDMLWHAMNEGVLPKVNNFYDSILEVKQKNKKSVPFNKIVVLGHSKDFEGNNQVLIYGNNAVQIIQNDNT